MLISIIVPVYNGENFLPTIYQSIKKQTYTNWELIFVNDTSKDNSLNIIKEYSQKDKKIKVINNKENCGPGGSKSEGIKVAEGDYILLLDCDDYISEDYLMDLVNKAKETNADVITTDFTKVNELGKISYTRSYQNKDIAFYQKISSVGKLIKKSFLMDNKLLLPYGKVLEDVLFHAGLVAANPTYDYINNAGYYYVYNESSISHTTLKQFTENSLNMGIKYLLSLKNNNLINKEKLDYYAYKYICWHLLKSGNKVGTEAMKKEYQQGFEFLEKEFPNYKKFKSLDLKYERLIIELVMVNILILRKLYLDWLFFKLYSNINLEKLWPKL